MEVVKNDMPTTKKYLYKRKMCMLQKTQQTTLTLLYIPESNNQMKIKPIHRKKLRYYLTEFYKRYPTEKFTIFHAIKYFKLRQKNNRDAWIGVSGDTGTGILASLLILVIFISTP